MKRLLLASLLFLSSAAAGAAATLNESDVFGGFGGTAQTATQIALGNEVINGALGSGTADFLRFSNLASGAQTITLTFGLISPNPNAAGSGGGTVTVSPFGTPALQNFNITKGGGRNGTISGTTTLSFSLDANYNGQELVFGLTQSSGNRAVTYAMSIPGNVFVPPPAPVPVPPAGALLLAAFGGLAIWRRKRGVCLHQPRTQAT